jgi:predicted ATP-grasp superfamily ATP-dependent carboligase
MDAETRVKIHQFEAEHWKTGTIAGKSGAYLDAVKRSSLRHRVPAKRLRETIQS